jgi:CRISPR/Cas system-associated endoribonuclease Cas2
MDSMINVHSRISAFLYKLTKNWAVFHNPELILSSDFILDELNFIKDNFQKLDKNKKKRVKTVLKEYYTWITESAFGIEIQKKDEIIQKLEEMTDFIVPITDEKVLRFVKVVERCKNDPVFFESALSFMGKESFSDIIYLLKGVLPLIDCSDLIERIEKDERK